jgi:hypothetical protein
MKIAKRFRWILVIFWKCATATLIINDDYSLSLPNHHQKDIFSPQQNFHLKLSENAFLYFFSSQKNTARVISERQEKVEKIIIFLLNFLLLSQSLKLNFYFIFSAHFFLPVDILPEKIITNRAVISLFFIISILFEIIFLHSIESSSLHSIASRFWGEIKTLLPHTRTFCSRHFQLLTKSLQNAAHFPLISLFSNDASNGQRSIRESKSSSLFSY